MPTKKPPNGRVVSVKVAPGELSELTPAGLAALIADARSAMAADRPAAVKRPRVSLSAADAAALDAVGWQTPYADASQVWRPIGSTPTADRNCLLAPFYTVVGAALAVGPVKLSDAARVLAATMGGRENKRSIASLMQTLANRLQRGIRQDAAMIRFTGTTGTAVAAGTPATPTRSAAAA